LSFDPIAPWSSAEQQRGGQMLNKVPAVTLSFWLIKLLSTTVGETGADYLAVDVGWGAGFTTGLMASLLAIALAMQMRARHHVPWLYWLTVVLVSVVGTQITDALTDGLGVSLVLSSAAFGAALIAIFLVWHAVEHTLSIRSIQTPRREGFYWAAILCTFALGTATGDLATEALGLGFSVGAMVFGTLILLTLVAWRLGAPAVPCFWLAYILTRPMGAALGDWLIQAPQYGGLGLGAPVTSALFLAVIVGLVATHQVRANLDRRSPAL
jgi:uncharacterized membrane-anchored protein